MIIITLTLIIVVLSALGIEFPRLKALLGKRRLGRWLSAMESPARKGRVGEQRVNRKLQGMAPDYRLLRDIMVRTRSGRTMQIDHVVVSRYGIFVVETKNYEGVIIGNGRTDEWHQNIWGKVYELYNPEMQNKSHVGMLKYLLPEVDASLFHSIVAFPDDTKLVLSNLSEYVVSMGAVRRVIASYTEPVLSGDEVTRIASRIEQANITDTEIRKQHKTEVSKAKALRRAKVLSGKCPMCGGNLVRRKSRYGWFIGCSNYPACRYIKQKTNHK